MESILKRVYGVELASQKIQLGLADDLAKATATGKASLDSMNSKLQELNKIDNEVIALSKLADKSQQEAYKIADSSTKVMMNIGGMMDKLETTAKELGISPKQIPNYNAAVSMFEAIDALAPKLNNFVFKGF